MKINTVYDKSGENKMLAVDIKNIKNALNSMQTVLEIDARSSDPTLSTTDDKVYLWYRTDTNQLSAFFNGTVKRVTLS